MEMIHDWESGPELLFFKGLDLSDQKRELLAMEPILCSPEVTGTAFEDDGSPRKRNNGVYLEQVYTPLFSECSPTALLVTDIINKIKNHRLTLNSFFQSIHSIEGYNILFSAYKDGDYYKPHRDRATLTLLAWMGEKDFDGGDLYLPDFDYLIPYEPNKVIVMPSHYMHEVTPISTNKEGIVRLCASAFIA